MNKRKVFTHGLTYLLLASVILNVVLFAKQRTKDKYETKSDTTRVVIIDTITYTQPVLVDSV